jgi:tetratricopeptide (TPR) repeat protein
MTGRRLKDASFWFLVWWYGREWHRLRWWALLWLPPALVALIVAASVSKPEPLWEHDQAPLAWEALLKHDWQDAHNRFTRLSRAFPTSNHYLYGLALSLEGLGESQRAGRLLDRVAPADGRGYGPAHLAQALRLRRGQAAEGLSADQRRRYEHHLLRAVESEPDLKEAHFLLGDFYLRQRRLGAAEKHLRLAAGGPDASLQLALLAAARNQRDETERQARAAVAARRRHLETNPNDHAARLEWAEAAVLLHQGAEALRILEEGWRPSHSAVYVRALVNTYVLRIRQLQREPAPRFGDVLGLVERGLDVDADHPELLTQLVSLSNGTGAVADRARARLRALETAKRPSARLEVCLGKNAWDRRRPAEARRYFERALQNDPGCAEAANNLAAVLALGTPTEARRALDLIDGLLKKYPGHPVARNTRGQVLVRLGRWQDGAQELEAVLRQSPAEPTAHLALAEAYDHLGKSAAAAHHRQQAEKWTAAASPPAAAKVQSPQSPANDRRNETDRSGSSSR